MRSPIMRALCLAALVGACAPGAAFASSQLAVTQLRFRPSFATGISLVAAGGGDRVVLTRRNGCMDETAAWSPDGSRIVFARSPDYERSYHLYLMRSDGSSLRRITHGAFDQDPAWSPDGRWIAYVSTDGIRLVRPDGSRDHVVPGTRDSGSPAWAPGRRIAFAHGGYVVTARVDGSLRRRIVRGSDAVWSPDGSTVAYTGPDGGVFTATASGAHARMIHSGMQPAWSPDGEQIAFTRWPSLNSFSVWVIKRDGSGARRVVSDARTPAWRPAPRV